MEFVLSHLAPRLWRGFVDLVTPSLCLSCAAPVGEPASLCVSCWGRLKLIEEPVCDALGTPFAYDQDESAKLVHALKYRDRPEAGLLMARMMARAGRRLIAQSDVMLPVPLHRFRLWRRRFNQSAFLAQRIAAMSGTPWRHDVLMRARPTRAQVGLDQEARRRNVRNAFAVRPGLITAVAGKSVLLVDDVRTTGATAEACAMALRKAGARQVNLLTFALVQLPSKPHI